MKLAISVQRSVTLAKLKELIQLAEIMRERLQDQNPNEQLILRCLDPIWPYIYPYGLISYLKKHQGEPPEKTDRLKMEKIQRAVTGSRKKWRSFVIGLCHTFRERHSLRRVRARMVKRAAKKGPELSPEELRDLAEKFREQALRCLREIDEAKLELFDARAAAERMKLAVAVRNEENIPLFLRLSPYLDYGKILETLPAEVLDLFRSRYESPTPRNLAFDALQEYICAYDALWEMFKKDLIESFNN